MSNLDSMLCVLCFADQRSRFFTPCMHLCVCEKCNKDLEHKGSNCPICRSSIQSFVKVYENEEETISFGSSNLLFMRFLIEFNDRE